jgi:hypothetical protein
VRVAIGRLGGALLGRQFFTQLELVVAVPGAFRKHRPEEIEIGLDGFRPGVSRAASPCGRNPAVVCRET